MTLALIYYFALQYELLKDHKALNTVRELLVIIRIWGLLRPSCLPVFLRSADNLDVLALLFCLLSKLVQPNGDTQQQVDDGLIGTFVTFLEFLKIAIGYNMIFIYCNAKLSSGLTL